MKRIITGFLLGFGLYLFFLFIYVTTGNPLFFNLTHFTWFGFLIFLILGPFEFGFSFIGIWPKEGDAK